MNSLTEISVFVLMIKTRKIIPHHVFAVCISFLLLGACTTDKNQLRVQLEDSHAKKNFLSKEVISFDIDLKFGGKEKLNANITMLTGSGKTKIELSNGEKIIVDGNDVYHSAKLLDSAKTRFDAYTWSYFFLMPYKLNDKGVIFSDYPKNKLNNTTYAAAKLNFESGTGDAPDDWYILYADTNTTLLHAAAYIVTAGKTKDEAENNPHAIEYLDYKNIDGVPIAHKWLFWTWTESEGLIKEIGEGKLSKIRFSSLKDSDFSTEGLIKL